MLPAKHNGGPSDVQPDDNALESATAFSDCDAGAKDCARQVDVRFLEHGRL
jgi:hypothetical protein